MKVAEHYTKNKERVKIAREYQKTCGCLKLRKIRQRNGSGYLCDHYNFAVIFPEFSNDDIWKDSRPAIDFFPMTDKKVLMSCKSKCGSDPHKIAICDFLRNIGCSSCNGCIQPKGTSLLFKRSLASDDRMMKMWSPNNKIDPKTVTLQSNNEYLFICEKGHESLAKASNRYNGEGCYTCSLEDKIIPFEITIEKAKKLYPNGEYLYDINSYSGAQNSMSIFCVKHQTWFNQSVHGHLYGYIGCEPCQSENKDSKGIRFIKSYLDYLNLVYKSEKTFDEFYNKNSNRKYRYDLYIESLHLLIEFDGKQHFEYVEPWGGEKRFIVCQKSDFKKDYYAISNGYNFLRFPFWVSNDEICWGLSFAIHIINLQEKIYLSYAHYSRNIKTDGYKYYLNWIPPKKILEKLPIHL